MSEILVKLSPCCGIEFVKEGTFEYPISFMRIICPKCGKEYMQSTRNVETGKIETFKFYGIGINEL